MSLNLNLQDLILYRDDMIIVMDKPCGIPVHAGPKGGVNLEDGFGDLRFDAPENPALAHRLDRATSGCLVLGCDRNALKRLGKMFQAGYANKTYIAVIPTVPEQSEGVIDVPLARVHKYKGWKMRVAAPDEEGAKETVTHYKVLNICDGHALVEFYPRTGRTHQLRVHSLHHFGCAILGDTLYGGEDADVQLRLFLHASRIVLPLYHEKPPVDVSAPLPAVFLPYESEK